MAEKNIEIQEYVEVNMDEKVTIRSIAPWSTGFAKIDRTGDIQLPPYGSARVARGELIAQAQNGNRLLIGTDAQGTHATIYIEDAVTRAECGFEDSSENRVQKILTTDGVKKLFEYKTAKTFAEKLQDMVVTRAEKCAIIEIIKREKINDFEKIRIVEDYTGYRV